MISAPPTHTEKLLTVFNLLNREIVSVNWIELKQL